MNLPKLEVIASMSLGFRFLGRPFCLGCCGKPGNCTPELGPLALKC